MKSDDMGASTLEETGVAHKQAEVTLLPVQRPPLQMVAESIYDDQQMDDSTTVGRTQLTPEQKARLAVVMARQARGGGHLTDGRYLAEMPNFRPSAGRKQQETIVAHAYYVD